MIFNKPFAEKAKKAKTVEEFIAVAEEYGYSVTKEEAEEYVKRFNSPAENNA